MRLTNVILAVAYTLAASNDFVSAATDAKVTSSEHSLPTRSLAEGPNEIAHTRFLRAKETTDEEEDAGVSTAEDEERAIIPWLKDLLYLKETKEFLRYVDYYNWVHQGKILEQVRKMMKLTEEQAKTNKHYQEFVTYLSKHKPGVPSLR